MAKRLPLTDEEGEVRELTEEDFRHALPFSSLPVELLAVLSEIQRRGRGPREAPRNTPTTIRVDADVLAALKATGPGWQTRVNAVPREWVKAQQPGDGSPVG